MKEVLEFFCVCALIYFLCDPEGCASTARIYIGVVKSVAQETK